MKYLLLLIRDDEAWESLSDEERNYEGIMRWWGEQAAAGRLRDGLELHPAAQFLLPCNWLQVKDNSMDPVHTSFLHAISSGYHFTEAFGALAELEWQETPYGMIYVATRRVGEFVWVRICDFTGQLAGAGATRFLAAFGAQIIRIEDPVVEGRWDILRGGPPYVDERRGINLGGAFNNHNIEKLGITLNLRTDRGRDLLRRLVALCDVVSENFAAGVLARLGFGYPELQAIKPDIVYVSNSGFGSRGPYAGFKTWGIEPDAIRVGTQSQRDHHMYLSL